MRLVTHCIAGVILVVGNFATPTVLASSPSTSPSPTIDWAVNYSAHQKALIDAASELLETAEVSYVMGGSQVGDGATCEKCNLCLENKTPKPSERFVVCPSCKACSLDCSHFTQLVFSLAGLAYPYLNTPMMLSLTAAQLQSRFQLIDMGSDSKDIQPGDMLVYRGHVALVERLQGSGTGDLVHATGGRDIRLPGQGIQRERFAKFSTFRGPLLRILRHQKLSGLMARNAEPLSAQSPRPVSVKKLRRVEKHRVAD